MLSKKQIEKYLNDPSHCPFCEGEDIVVMAVAHLKVFTQCDHCSKCWIDYLKLINVEEISEIRMLEELPCK